MSLCRVVACVFVRRCLLWPVCSLGKTLSLCPASIRTPGPNLSVTPDISGHPTFLSSVLWWKWPLSFFPFVLALDSLVCHHRTFQLQPLWHYWSEHRLGLPWYWMVCLGNEQRALCHFWNWSKYCILDSFVDYRATSFPLRTSLVAQMVKRLSAMRESWVGKICWRRKWQSTPVLLPGKSHGQRSLIGYSPWGRKETDMTERLHFHFHFL